MSDLTEADKYRAFRNLLFNELQITKHDIRVWILEAVRDQINTVERSNHIKRMIDDTIKAEIKAAVRNALGVSHYSRSSPAIERAVADAIRGRLDIRLKDEQP